MPTRAHHKIKLIALVTLIIYGAPAQLNMASASGMPFAPGEKLKYALRWENVPAGELNLEIRPMTTINGSPTYHFVMTAKSNSAVDIFCKIRDRIDAYANVTMTRSVHYRKHQAGSRGNRLEEVQFDWSKGQARFSDKSNTHEPIAILPGSFDPLSAFYYTRMALSAGNQEIERPVTDGKKTFMGNARIIGRETVTLKNGKKYDTVILQPEMGLFGEMFKDNKDTGLRIWVTNDVKGIPVQIKAKVKVGHFIGELVSAEGV